jgi:alanine dehydrogenase
MKIGIAAEKRPGEKRVILLPDQLKDIAARHEVLVEKGAGEGIKVADRQYEKAGARTADSKDVYACDLVLRIYAPVEEDLRLMRPGSTVMAMLHFRARPKLEGYLRKYRINAIALEDIRNIFNTRLVEALHQTGYLGMRKGLELWKGDPSKATVKIMGYGRVAWGAIQAAARDLSRVIILNKSHVLNMEDHIPGTDILVNAFNWPYEIRGREPLVTRDMLKLMQKGSVVIDLISNPENGSPIESVHTTTLADISYEIEGIVHAACWGWAGLDPEDTSRRFSIQIAPILREVAENGLAGLPEHIERATFRS